MLVLPAALFSYVNGYTGSDSSSCGTQAKPCKSLGFGAARSHVGQAIRATGQFSGPMNTNIELKGSIHGIDRNASVNLASTPGLPAFVINSTATQGTQITVRCVPAVFMPRSWSYVLLWRALTLEGASLRAHAPALLCCRLHATLSSCRQRPGSSRSEMRLMLSVVCAIALGTQVSGFMFQGGVFARDCSTSCGALSIWGAQNVLVNDTFFTQNCALLLFSSASSIAAFRGFLAVPLRCFLGVAGRCLLCGLGEWAAACLCPCPSDACVAGSRVQVFLRT